MSEQAKTRLDRLIEGLTILRKYQTEDERIDFCAEHDVLYVGPEMHGVVSEEDFAALEKLGFHWDEDLDTFVVFT